MPAYYDLFDPGDYEDTTEVHHTRLYEAPRKEDKTLNNLNNNLRHL